MKKNLFVYLTILCSAALFSCKKSSTTTNNSSNLGAGKASISFTSNANFASSTSFSVSNSIYTHAQTATGAGVRVIVLTATETSGLNTRSAVLNLYVDAAASTSGGNISASFAGSSDPYADLALNSTNGSTSGPTMLATTGTATITKLTDSEIEGTFTGSVTDGGSNTLSLTNGTFAGKF